MIYTLPVLNKVVKGEIVHSNGQHSNLIVKNILLDSRSAISSEGTVFFAIQGKRNDGHKYIETLYKQGVRVFVVSCDDVIYSAMPDAVVIKVKNTLAALQQFVSYHRKQFNIPVVGITGSNGKTIVKEWLYHLLSDDKKIIRSPKSYNSQIGVPLSVWQMTAEHELAIFEAGISEPDEMDKLQPVILPTIGIFTNIGQAHDENFINHSQKVGEKLKLFTKVEVLIYCIDHYAIREVIIKSEMLKNNTFFTWSVQKQADLNSIKFSTSNKTTRIVGVFRDKEIEIEIPFTDRASIENAIHCWALMLYLGYSNEFISQRMLRLTPIAMRLEMKEGINNCTIINDSYNSDINSLNIALDFLNQQHHHPKKTIILSDIPQSGRDEVDLYNEVAELIVNKGIQRVIGIGPALSRQKRLFEKQESFFYKDTEDFLKNYSSKLFSHENILLKGARKYEFERISQLIQQKAHETVLEINLSAIIHNLNYYQSQLRSGAKIMAMVKAFSYGSGSYEIASILQFHRVDYLAVAYADEGVELRNSGIVMPIMVMNPDEESFDAIIRFNLEPEIYNFRSLQLLIKAIERLKVEKNTEIAVHIKFDTGMHRLGFSKDDIPQLAEELKTQPHIIVKSVFSHLAASESLPLDWFSKKQIQEFETICNQFLPNFKYPVMKHILNSEGILRFADAQYEMVRLGLGLYGISQNPETKKHLKNVSVLKSIISQIRTIEKDDSVGYSRSWIAVKKTEIAVIPVGYADGLSRKLSNGKGKVLINNKQCPIIGNICMDMCMVDVSGVNAHEGDEVIVFGNDYSIDDIARDMDTIPYEVMTLMSRRIKRVYIQE